MLVLECLGYCGSIFDSVCRQIEKKVRSVTLIIESLQNGHVFLFKPLLHFAIDVLFSMSKQISEPLWSIILQPLLVFSELLR